ncbi:MAG: hypothetical protein IKZ53_02125 [Selenomonadaceae bacterium]|nr:hypothetical protein [Selenomonadaceae bacterium]
MEKIFTIIILLSLMITGCGKEDSPENALNEIKIALAERDSQKLSTRADLDEFFSETYDATTIELAKKYDEYKEKYPDDPYFQHSGEFLTEYNAENKTNHLKFLDGVKESFFAKIPEPSTPEENPTAYVANEFEKIRKATNATVKEITLDEDNHATMTLFVEGDDSLRGRFIGQMIFKLGFTKDAENRWHFDEIKNLDELTPALVDKAEIIWVNL